MSDDTDTDRARALASVEAWEQRGTVMPLGDEHIFVIDLPGPASSNLPPALVLHGFPSSSFDWRGVIDALTATRRVVLFDFAGFGLSSKPDRHYSIRGYADTTEALAAAIGLDRVALVTHDVGDSVGGEILARSLDGALGFDIVSRVITNGTIYMSLVQFSEGQQFLLALDDARLDLGDVSEQAFKDGIAYTFSAGHKPSAEELDAQWQLAHRGGGDALLPRTIRYIEDRQAEEERYTGAIEQHPSPIGIVWGDEDPIAVVAMAHRLAERRPESPVTILEGVGHYPMIEAPDAFGEAVVSLLAQIEG